VQFTPPATGLETGTLTLSSAAAGSPYVLSLTGNGLPLTGLLLTPVTQDFGPVPINSASATELFAVRTLVRAAIRSPWHACGSGDFSVSNAVSGGVPCGGALAYTASCFVQIDSRHGAGPRHGNAQHAGGQLDGERRAHRIRFELIPASRSAPMRWSQQRPGSSSTQQTVTLLNTSTNAEQVGTVSATTTSSSATSFSASSNCGTLKRPEGPAYFRSRSLRPTASAAGTLTIPVTSTVGERRC